MTRMGWLLLLVSGCATATPAKKDASATTPPATPTRTTPATATATATTTAADQAHVSASGATRIDLGPAGVRVLDATGIENYTAARSDIVKIDVTPDGQRLLIRALHPGYTGLTLLGADGSTRSYDIHVAGAPLAADGDRIELPLGGQKVVPSDGVTNFATTADVVQIKSRQDGRQLILNAVKPGDSALTLIYADGTIHSYAIHVSATTPQ